MAVTVDRIKDGSVLKSYSWCKKMVCKKRVQFEARTFFEKEILKPNKSCFLFILLLNADSHANVRRNCTGSAEGNRQKNKLCHYRCLS